MRLNPETLEVSTFETANLAIGPGGGYCCTGEQQAHKEAAAF